MPVSFLNGVQRASYGRYVEHLPPKIAPVIFIWTTPSVHQFRRREATITALVLHYNSPQSVFSEHFWKTQQPYLPSSFSLSQINVTSRIQLVSWITATLLSVGRIPLKFAHSMVIESSLIPLQDSA